MMICIYDFNARMPFENITEIKATLAKFQSVSGIELNKSCIKLRLDSEPLMPLT